MTVLLAALDEGIAIRSILTRRIELTAFAIAGCPVALDVAKMGRRSAVPAGVLDVAGLDDDAAHPRRAVPPAARQAAGANEGRAATAPDTRPLGRTGRQWNVATNRWQTMTSTVISKETLNMLSAFCDEFLIHAADVEGKQQGMDEELITFLGSHSPIPVTYAGGARDVKDLDLCKKLSNGKVDLTIGSALDIFGGKGAKYFDCIEYNKKQK